VRGPRYWGGEVSDFTNSTSYGSTWGGGKLQWNYRKDWREAVEVKGPRYRTIQAVPEVRGELGLWGRRRWVCRNCG